MTHSGDTNSGAEVVTLKLDELVGVRAIVFVLSAYKFGNLKYCESACVAVKDGGNEIHSVSIGGLRSETSGLLMVILFKHPGRLYNIVFE